MAVERGEPGDGDETGNDTDMSRLLALSDGVFAIAITLLVLDLAVPSGLADAAALNDALANQLPNFLALALSFIVIGVFWVAHRFAFRQAAQIDATLIWLDLAFLGSIVLMPFTTNLIAEYGEMRVPTIIYAANLALASIMLIAINGRVAVQRGGSVLDGVARAGTLDTAFVFLLSIPVAWFVSADAGKATWLLLIVSGPISGRLLAKRRATA